MKRLFSGNLVATGARVARQWSARIGYATAVLTIALPARAYAVGVGSNLPWDQPIQTITNDLSGPVAHGVVTSAIIMAGMMWAHTEHGSGARKLSAVGFGGAASLGAVQLMTALFPGAGGLL
jgi:type IV secretory pathway VirB2 component (pilin)